MWLYPLPVVLSIWIWLFVFYSTGKYALLGLGLTLAGVGNGTTIDHVQVSHSGDDSYEFFGGSVNARFLVANQGLDDDFDMDNGFSGKLQFGVAVRDANQADASGSNGLEHDNDASGSTASPFTTPIITSASLARWQPPLAPRTTTTSALHTYAATRTPTCTTAFSPGSPRAC